MDRQLKPHEYVLRVREALGLTQTQFAELIGVTDRTIRFYESGKATIPQRSLMAVERLAERKRIRP